MSTPITSPAPDMPTGSSNPVSWKSWFIKIGDWIKALSPAGATGYDSNAQAITANTGYTSSGASVRRQGNRAACSGALVSSATATITTVFTKIGTLPAGGSLRPPLSRFYTVGVFGTSPLQLQFTNAGDVNARALTGTVSLVNGTSIYLDGLVWDL